jgi:hypothetical protein
MMLLVAGLSGLSIPAQALYYLDNFSQPTSDWSVTSSSTGVPATHLDTGINVVGGSRFSSVTKRQRGRNSLFNTIVGISDF